MIKVSSLSHSELTARINYDPELGTFHWTNSARNTNRTRSKPASESSFATQCGRIRINGEVWTARQLAIYWMTGVVPQGRIKSKDGDPNNYRFENLELIPSINGGEKYICRTKSGCNSYRFKVRKNGKYYGFSPTLAGAIAIRDSIPELCI